MSRLSGSISCGLGLAIYDQPNERKKKYENLELQTRKLHEEMLQAFKENDREVLELSTENEELKKYIEKLKNSALKYKEKDVSEVHKKTRTLVFLCTSEMSFLSRAQVALW